MKELLISFLVVIGIVMLIIFLGGLSSSNFDNQKIDDAKKSENIQTELTAEQIKDLDERIKHCLSTGSIYSINIERSEVRIDPFVWANYNVDEKKRLVWIFGKYCAAKRGDSLFERMITIKSSLSDEKFAGYSWDEIKIYK